MIKRVFTLLVQSLVLVRCCQLNELKITFFFETIVLYVAENEYKFSPILQISPKSIYHRSCFDLVSLMTKQIHSNRLKICIFFFLNFKVAQSVNGIFSTLGCNKTRT